MNNIEVSILCTAYNHEKYIEKCIQGFLSQETSFKYEIIIHDDASTDETCKIIEKYKDIICIIYANKSVRTV